MARVVFPRLRRCVAAAASAAAAAACLLSRNFRFVPPTKKGRIRLLPCVCTYAQHDAEVAISTSEQVLALCNLTVCVLHRTRRTNVTEILERFVERSTEDREQQRHVVDLFSPLYFHTYLNLMQLFFSTAGVAATTYSSRL